VDHGRVGARQCGIRDDRFSVAFDTSGAPAVFTSPMRARGLARPLRAPASLVEDMYRPDRFGCTGTGTIEITAAR
jgi:uncharacterized protein YfaS (alpha-2-macroglobulin family)